MSIKISQLIETINVGVNDSIPIARGSLETYRTPARQFITTASNIGLGPGQFFSVKTDTTPTTLQFRTLSATGENLAIATVGNTVVISSSAQNPIKTSFISNGATTIWPLIGFNSNNAANYRVDFDGVLQEPFIDYNLSANNIVFTVAPPLSTKVVIVSNNMVRVNEAQPAPNTITTTMMTDNSITTDKLANTVGANAWRFVSSNFTINVGDRIGINTLSGTVTGILPLSPLSGNMVTLGDTNGTWGINNLIINGNGNTILGDPTLVCNTSYKLVVLLYNGADWKVLV